MDKTKSRICLLYQHLVLLTRLFVNGCSPTQQLSDMEGQFGPLRTTCHAKWSIVQAYYAELKIFAEKVYQNLNPVDRPPIIQMVNRSSDNPYTSLFHNWSSCIFVIVVITCHERRHEKVKIKHTLLNIHIALPSTNFSNIAWITYNLVP